MNPIKLEEDSFMKNKRALVTGASRGIGYEIAKAFSSAGVEVCGTRTKKSGKNEAVSEWLTADFGDQSELDKCIKEVKKISPDILINCAGVNFVAPFINIKPSEFLRIHQINVFAPFMFCKAVVPFMKRKGWGRIVNVSSIWGKVGKEYRASYMASKFALDGITLALAAEHSKDGILANCVAPGFTETDLTRRVLGNEGMKEIAKAVPTKRLGQPREIAEFIFYLGSEKNTYITGQNIAIDGGFTRV